MFTPDLEFYDPDIEALILKSHDQQWAVHTRIDWTQSIVIPNGLARSVYADMVASSTTPKKRPSSSVLASSESCPSYRPKCTSVPKPLTKLAMPKRTECTPNDWADWPRSPKT